jgi:streptogramin lyase
MASDIDSTTDGSQRHGNVPGKKEARRMHQPFEMKRSSPPSPGMGTSLLWSSLVVLLLVTLLGAPPAPALAQTPFKVTFSTQNFGGVLLRAEPTDLDTPTHAIFTVEDGSQLWYSLEEQATPASLHLQAADPAHDVVSTVFTKVGLLKPAQILLVNAKGEIAEDLDLAVDFTEPNQQLQITLDPFDYKAAAMDIIGLLLDYVGLITPSAQVGLLTAGQITDILDAVEKFQELNELVNNLITMGKDIANGESITRDGLNIAVDMYNLFSTKATREKLAAILAKAVQGALPNSSVLKTVLNFPIKDLLTLTQIANFYEEYLIETGVFAYHHGQLPTILLQSVEEPTPTPTTQSTLPTGTITEFASPSGASSLRGITLGPDGNLWFTEASAIGRITPAGQITEFPVPTPQSVPWGITTGPDGNLWFTESFGNNIGRMTPTGQAQEFPVGFGTNPAGITVGPDGNLWYIDNAFNRIGQITLAGHVTEFPVTAGGLYEITVGSDGNLWFTAGISGLIERMTPAGQVTVFHLPSAFSGPLGITAGPDGNLWFTEFDGNKIGRITPAGQITEFSIPTPGTEPYDITTGPDGNLWFTQQGSNQIGSMTLNGQVTEFSIPTSNSVPSGITAGPGRTIWFTEAGGRVGRLTLGT